jgi:pyridoxamine 5'-phosphate oxidase
MTDPIARFRELLERARQADIREPTAMALATADAEGRPSVRMVLLKGVDEQGFTFYTNLESRKAAELTANPWAALCFHWQPLEVQVRVEGAVTPVADVEADAYFASRPRGSQIGAWASLQSRPLPSLQLLRDRVQEVVTRFGEGSIPRPEVWSGFRVAHERIEFWFGRPDRLHERELYRSRADGGWEVELLYP